MRSMLFILDDDDNSLAVITTKEWSDWFSENSERRVIADDTVQNVRISTVFLGLDHNHSGVGPPLLFETMIFGGDHDQHMWRCSTKEQAEEQHARTVSFVRDNIRKVE